MEIRTDLPIPTSAAVHCRSELNEIIGILRRSLVGTSVTTEIFPAYRDFRSYAKRAKIKVSVRKSEDGKSITIWRIL